MRLLVTADTHLGSPIRSAALRNPALGDRLKQASRDTFRDIIDLAITQNVDAIVLAGDIFDNDFPDLKSRTFLITQLSRAVTAGVSVVLIRGNHDALLDHTSYGELGPDIHLLHKDNPSVEIAGVMFHGLSFDKRHTAHSFLPDYPRHVAGKINVGLMHTSLGGAAGHDPYAPCAESDLLAHGYDLWCLGHIHMPFERVSGHTLAVMPGIPQPRHFGEQLGGSVGLVTLGNGAPQHTRHAVGHLRFTTADLDLTQCTNQTEVLDAISATLHSAKDPDRDTAVRLQAMTARYTASDLHALATEVLETIDGVFLDKVKASPPPNPDNDKADDLSRLMRAELQTAGFAQASTDILDELRNLLPPDVRDAIAPDTLDALLDEAINEVTLSLHGADT